MVTTILLDFDNTLIPTREIDDLAVKDVYKWLLNCGENKEKSLSICWNYLSQYRLTPTPPDAKADYAELLSWRKNIWNKILLPHQLQHFLDDIFNLWHESRLLHYKLSPEITQLLLHLRKDYNLAIVTNGTSVAQWEKLSACDMSQYVGCIVVSGDMGILKPHKDIFLHTCKALKVRPDECMMVGDKSGSDILCAINAGLAASVLVEPLRSHHGLAPRGAVTVDGRVCNVVRHRMRDVGGGKLSDNSLDHDKSSPSSTKIYHHVCECYDEVRCFASSSNHMRDFCDVLRSENSMDQCVASQSSTNGCSDELVSNNVQESSIAKGNSNGYLNSIEKVSTCQLISSPDGCSSDSNGKIGKNELEHQSKCDNVVINLMHTNCPNNCHCIMEFDETNSQKYGDFYRIFCDTCAGDVNQNTFVSTQEAVDAAKVFESSYIATLTNSQSIQGNNSSNMEKDKPNGDESNNSTSTISADYNIRSVLQLPGVLSSLK